jgi:hypothetical protein
MGYVFVEYGYVVVKRLLDPGQGSGGVSKNGVGKNGVGKNGVGKNGVGKT